MANALYQHSFSGNYPVLVSRKMQHETIREIFWGKFGKFTTKGEVPVNQKNRPSPVSSPIAFHYELKNKSGELIEVPMLRQLKQAPRVGEQDVEGHEEEMKLNIKQVPVELMRSGAVPQYSTIGTQVNRDMMLLKNAKPALQGHYARSMNHLLCSYAMYYGYSWNVLASDRWSGDSKISAQHHPHIYIAGQGKVPYDGTSGYPGTAAYNQEAGTMINALTASDVLNMSFLQYLKTSPAVLKIPRIQMKDGNPLWIMIAHPWQIKSLEDDAKFRELANATKAQAYAKENPLLYGCQYVAAGFAIFSSETSVWPVRVASSVPQYGPSNFQHGSDPTGDLDSFESYASDDAFAGFIIGSNALSLAIASRLGFAKAEFDYGQKVGVEYHQIIGAARSDYHNREDGSTGQYLINDSSAIFITKAIAPTA